MIHDERFIENKEEEYKEIVRRGWSWKEKYNMIIAKKYIEISRKSIILQDLLLVIFVFVWQINVTIKLKFSILSIQCTPTGIIQFGCQIKNQGHNFPTGCILTYKKKLKWPSTSRCKTKCQQTQQQTSLVTDTMRTYIVIQYQRNGAASINRIKYNK